jgi:hypothetical protein
LTLYVGGSNSTGRLTARLSDGSAKDLIGTEFQSAGSFDVVHTITYRAASAGQRLFVQWAQVSGGGSVTLQAAALAGTSASPPAVPTNVVASDGTSPTSVAVSWTAVSGATSYTVYRSTSAGTLGSAVGSPITNSFSRRHCHAGARLLLQRNGHRQRRHQRSVEPGQRLRVSHRADGADQCRRQRRDRAHRDRDVDGRDRRDQLHRLSLDHRRHAGQRPRHADRFRPSPTARPRRAPPTTTASPPTNAAGTSALSAQNSGFAASGGGGGGLVGAVLPVASPVNLTAVGTSDWGQWASPSLFNHKSTGGGQISTYTAIGSPWVSGYGNDPRTLTWTDGTPPPQAAPRRACIWAAWASVSSSRRRPT